MDRFTFSSALAHFRNTQGPPGFIWKFVLAYFIGFYVFCGIYFAAFSTLVPGLIEASSDPYAVETFFSQSLGNIILFYVIIILAGMIFGSVFEASALRRYTRREGFSIGFGADELRLIGLYFLWMLTFIATYIAAAIPFGIIVAIIGVLAQDIAPLLMPLILVIAMIAIYGVVIYVTVRLSPAAAVTIRDRKLTFLSARSATKGRFWPLFGAYLVLMIIAYVALIIIIAVATGVSIGLLGSSSGALQSGSPAGFSALIGNVPLLIFGFLISVGVVILYAFFYLAFIGIPARAAVTDPNWTDSERTAETFD